MGKLGGDHRRIHRHGTGRRQAVRRARSSRLIQARRQEALDDAVKLIGRNVTLFTVQKALPLIKDNGSIFMTGSNASLGAFPDSSYVNGLELVTDGGTTAI